MRSFVRFFLLTSLLSWTLWIAAAVISGPAAPPSWSAAISSLLYIIGVFAPALVALALTARTEGRAGMMKLLGQIGQLPGEISWYVFAVGYFVTIKFGVAIVYRLATGTFPGFSKEAWYTMALAIPFSTPVQAGEEVGWRGYVLPLLARRLGLGRASIVVGVIWAGWHLPFFFVPGTDKSGQSFPVYLLVVTALSVAMAWLYWRTNGSLLLSMLMHAAVNNTNIVPSGSASAANPFSLSAPLTAWLTAILLWICAVFFLIKMRD